MTRVNDFLTVLWYRWLYCTRYWHYKVHEGQCLNCGKTLGQK